MITLGARLSISAIPRILITIISLIELLVILRVIVHLYLRLTHSEGGKVNYLLEKATDPVLFPIQRSMDGAISATGIDFSPAVAVVLCELLSWLIKLVFR